MEDNHDFSQMSSDEIWEVLPNLSGRERGFALMSLAHFAWSNHEVDQLLPLAMEAKDLFVALDDKRELALAYDLIGSAHAHENNYQEALTAYAKALTHIDELTGDSEFGMIHRHTADTYRFLKNFALAEHHYELSLNAYIDCGEFHPARHAVDALTLMLAEIGQYDKALKHLDDAVEWTIGNVDPLSAMEIHLNYAYVYNQLRMPNEAINHTNIAIGLSRTCGCPSCPVRTSLRMAESLCVAERYEDALLALDSAEEHAVKSGKRFHMALGLTARARTYRFTDPLQARILAEQACAILKVLNDSLAHTYAELVLADLAFDEGKFIDAAHLYNDIAADFVLHGRPVAAARTKVKQAKADLAATYYEAALLALTFEDAGPEYLTVPVERYEYLATKIQALFANKKFAEAKAIASELILYIEPGESPEYLATAHEYLARMNMTSNPVESDRSASLAMAYFAEAGNLNDVQRIASDYFTTRQVSLDAIAEDNERRAVAEASNELNIFLTQSASIEELVGEHNTPKT